jgi:hypothetical protein
MFWRYWFLFLSFFYYRSCRHSVQIRNYFASGSGSGSTFAQLKKDLYMQLQAGFGPVIIIEANVWFLIRVFVIS